MSVASASLTRQKANLAKYHTFGFNVTAKHIIEVSSKQDLACLQSHHVPGKTIILSGGSNTIFLEDFDGIVVLPKYNSFSVISEDEYGVEIEVGASVNWHQLVTYCLTQGFYGLENLADIPGNVGAAPIQNIGAYGVCLSDYLTHVTGMWIPSGCEQEMSLSDCNFSYRDSIFKTDAYKNKFMITSVGLRLSKEPVINLSHKDIAKAMAPLEKTPEQLFDTIVETRARKLPNPEVIPNSGSFFKNPIITHDQLQTLKDKHPKMPYYSYKKSIKIPAAWLIEHCGWKGRWLGHVGVYQHHALVMIQDGQAKPSELKQLLYQITTDVYDEFNIMLIPEVVLVEN